MASMLHMRDTKKWVCARMCARTHTAFEFIDRFAKGIPLTTPPALAHGVS